MSVKTEGLYAPDWLKAEEDNQYSREKITVLAGASAARVLTNGMVLGKITLGTVTAAANGAGTAGANTGNGTCTPDTTTPTLAGAQVGVYTAMCIAAATNSGTFRVTDPQGNVLGDVAVGGTWANQIKFVIADGAQDFIVGDGFKLTVAAGSGKFVQMSLTATDGSQVAAGILVSDVTAPDGVDATGVAVVRDAIVSKSQLVWPATATDAQKATALAALKALGIIARDAA